MDELLLHDHTRTQLAALSQDPPHALLLVGPNGLGKRTVAAAWAQQLTEPAFNTIIEPDEKGTIGIDVVRTLYQRTRSRQEKRQVVIIDHAEAMGIEAQNAFLKLLEEPPQNVTFVLTAPHTDMLLPTISSRAQTVQLQRTNDAALQAWLQNLPQAPSTQNLTQLLFIADGRPATALRLLGDETLFQYHRGLMQRAKQLLAAPVYERLCLTAALITNREDLVIILEAMAYMVKLQLASGKAEARWLTLADALETCLLRLSQNGNPRAQLTHLFLSY